MQKPVIFAVLILSLAASAFYLDRNFKYPFDVVNFSLAQNQPPLDQYAMFDLSSVVFGVRKMASDIAWIQLLQYYGGMDDEKESGVESEREFNGVTFGNGRYQLLQKLTQRVVRLDPYFYSSYMYGGACLAWNLDRPDEGIAVFDEGIKNAPNYWQFTIYKMAIIYKKLDRYEDMVGKLEEALKYKDCPIMVKAMLANIYKKKGNYIRALQLWVEIYDLGPTDYQIRAGEEITKLRVMTGM